MNTYILVYLCSFILAFIITPVVIRFAYRFNVVDSPDVRKVHSQPVPRIGGVAVFVPVICMTITVLFLQNAVGISFREVLLKKVVLLAGAAFMFFIGFVDDIRGLPARVKLLCQFIAAGFVYIFGIRITFVAVGDWFSLSLGWLSMPLTVFWIIGITNAVNLIDGLDGLAAGISVVACGVMVVLSIHFGQPVMAVMMISLLGALSGFLFFNFNPAKIFLGDCGSLFIGFTLASASVMCTAKSNALVSLALPILALGIPIFDTLFSMLRRFLERRSLFSPDRGHFHHRLLALGLRQRQVVFVAYAVTLLATGLGIFMIFARDSSSIVIFGSVLLLLILVFRVIGAVRLRETIEKLRERRAITSRIKQETENFEKVELYFQQAKTFEQWWQSVCSAAECMRFAAGSMLVVNRDGSRRHLEWKCKKSPCDDMVKIVVPVRDRRCGSALNLEIKIPANGSLESAGRRAALFGRLIEEYGVANLPSNEKRSFTSEVEKCEVTV